jgi:N-acetylglucosaminyldiphosphoundecaprenol N-acetyl-beta-D-mannosaminyltransferase
LGGTPEVVRAAVRAAQQTYNGLHFAGFHHGYFSDEDIGNVIKEINYSKADCLFVGMPTPRKENFLAKYRSAIDAPFVMGVGGSFDVLAGKVDRAPHWLRSSGFEWLFRLLQEPRRMFWRYLSTNSIFLFLVMQALFKAMRTAR